MSYMLVDGNSIGWASYHGSALEADGVPTQAIYHSLKTIRNLRESYPEYSMLILWDAGRLFRTEFYPEYKSNRGSETVEAALIRDDYGEQISLLKLMLKTLGVSQVWADRYEADDLAGYFVRKARRLAPYKSVLLITGDRDWQQFCGRYAHVTWIDPRKPDTRRVSDLNFTEYTGFRNELEFLEAKALEGDPSDNIAGIPGIGKKCALGIMQTYGSVNSLRATYSRRGPFDDVNKLPKELSRHKKKINEFLANNDLAYQHNQNFGLMDLCSDHLDGKIKKALTGYPAKKDLKNFRIMAGELQFASITMNIDKWDIF